MGTAGTDASQHRDFADAAEQYRRDFIKVMNDDVTQHAKGVETGYTAGVDLWEKVPEFQYESPGFRRVVTSRWPDLAVLAAWFAAATVVAIAATARVRVS